MALAKKERDRLKTKYGEWALVTGASSGMGMELAKGLARGNLTLSINARNEMVLNKSAQEWAISIRRKWKWLLQAIRNQMEFQN